MMRLALIGMGNIGGSVLRHVVNDSVRNFEVVAVCDRIEPPEDIRKILSDRSIPFVREVVSLPPFKPEYVLEAASQEVVREYSVFFLKQGISMIVLSTGAFSDSALYQEVLHHCFSEGPRLIIPSGAVGGLDIIRAAAMGSIELIHLKTTKPACSLEARGEDYAPADESGGPVVLYRGNAADAARRFPKNINVAMILALAGIGPERTTVEIVADPSCTENVHQISIQGDFGTAEITLRNRPSPSNPKTSLTAVLSVLSVLDQMHKGFRLGS